MTSPARRVTTVVAALLILVALVFQFFVVLSGSVNTAPVDRVWFLSAETKNINSAPPTTAWTFFSTCTLDGLLATDCHWPIKAVSFNLDATFGSNPDSIPAQKSLCATMAAFAMLALMLNCLASLGGVTAAAGVFLAPAMPKKLLAIEGALAAASALLQAAAATSMTAWTTRAQTALEEAGHLARIGPYAHAFFWGACILLGYAALLLNMPHPEDQGAALDAAEKAIFDKLGGRARVHEQMKLAEELSKLTAGRPNRGLDLLADYFAGVIMPGDIGGWSNYDSSGSPTASSAGASVPGVAPCLSKSGTATKQERHSQGAGAPEEH